jgi:hypothetical protein
MANIAAKATCATHRPMFHPAPAGFSDASVVVMSVFLCNALRGGLIEYDLRITIPFEWIIMQYIDAPFTVS